MPALAKTQHFFSQALLGKELTRFQEHVEENGIPKADRLRAYDINVFYSLEDVLASTFSYTKKLLGDKTFEETAFRFIAQQPPIYGSLYRYGDGFPRFLGDTRVKPERDSFGRHDGLNDIAQLEWLHQVAYFAVDEEPLDFQKLTEYAEEELGQLQFFFAKHVGLLESPKHFQDLWNWLGDQEGPQPPVLDKLAYILVYRTDFEDRHVFIEHDEYAFLKSLQAGQTFEEAYTAASAINASFQLQEFLAQCFAKGLFTRTTIRTPDGPLPTPLSSARDKA